MGGFRANIGHYSLDYGDYEWDYVKTNKPKEYYENKTFDGQLTNLKTKEVIDIEIPFLELANIKLLKKYYDYEHKKGWVLQKFLWKYLKENFPNYVPEQYIYLYGTLSLREYEDPSKFIDTYYLQSEVGDDDVKLGIEPKLHKIHNYKDYDWIKYKLLMFDWKP